MTMPWEYEYANPEYFYLFLLIPLLLGWYVWREIQKAGPEVNISSLTKFHSDEVNYLAIFRHSLIGFRVLAIGFIIIALARPQSSQSWEDITSEGIDIVIALDVSASMLAKDFKPNRLDASKKVAMDFITERKNDRMGLVVYEGESFTQCPLTSDHNVLLNLFRDLRSGLIEGGTAIGMGIATGVNRLRHSDAVSKVIILLTDGVNNSGSITPTDAAEIAKAFGIRIYTIGVGSLGKALSPVAMYPNGQYKFDYVDVEIDEATLEKVAAATDGKYFRATDNRKLEEIYQEIDQLEKTKIQVTRHMSKSEKFFPFALIAACLALLEFILRTTLFRSAP